MLLVIGCGILLISLGIPKFEGGYLDLGFWWVICLGVLTVILWLWFVDTYLFFRLCTLYGFIGFVICVYFDFACFELDLVDWIVCLPHGWVGLLWVWFVLDVALGFGLWYWLFAFDLMFCILVFWLSQGCVGLFTYGFVLVCCFPYVWVADCLLTAC